ncbi:MAG TPA: TOMM precursor leader peptide-binding protein [Pseudonocardiaceae bacterium]|jgi:bacteriocin biosynthesis cyclodehydratase domain-containing protein|nr:TOMM precursor leader peptide-binding protein [Pseudonocardiaceae bacterium]
MTTHSTPATSTPNRNGDRLPERPRLLAGLPVLRRTAGETQIGTDPRHAVVVTGLPEPVAALLHRLDGRHTTDELMARAGPRHQPVLRQTLSGLASIGLLHDTAPAPGPPARLAADRTAWALRSDRDHSSIDRHRVPAVVVIHGSGRIAVALATLLAASGVGWVHTVADGVVQPEDTGTGYLDEDIGDTRADAAARAVRRTTPETRTTRLAPHQLPDLVVLTDTPVPDPRLSAGLSSAGLPHLVVHGAEGTGVVGPLVVPGRTSCLHCVDLHNTDTDACWPALAAQLAAHPQPADLASAQATAAFAAGQVLRFLHTAQQGTVCDTTLPVWGAAMEIDVFTARSTRVTWPPHPRCPCGAARATPPPDQPPDHPATPSTAHRRAPNPTDAVAERPLP